MHTAFFNVMYMKYESSPKTSNPILLVFNLLKINDHLVKFSRKKRLIGGDSNIKR